MFYSSSKITYDFGGQPTIAFVRFADATGKYLIKELSGWLHYASLLDPSMSSSAARHKKKRRRDADDESFDEDERASPRQTARVDSAVAALERKAQRVKRAGMHGKYVPTLVEYNEKLQVCE